MRFAGVLHCFPRAAVISSDHSNSFASMPYRRAGSGFVRDSHVCNAVDAGSQLITTVLGFAPTLTAIALLFRQHILDYFVARVGELEERPAQILTILLGCLRRVCDAHGGRSRRHRGHGLARAAACHSTHRRVGHRSFVAMRDGLSIVRPGWRDFE
jgi:hypothetical protein